MTKPLALLIGMGPGLGEALVRAFADAGHCVAFVGRRATAIAEAEARLRAEGLDVTGWVGDAGDSTRMGPLFADIHARHGTAEVLIYNAAVIKPARFATPSGLSEASYAGAAGWSALGSPASPEYVLSCFRSNVLGAHHAAQVLAPAMIARGRGTMLFTGGVLAFDPWIEWGVTAMGKAALRSLGHSLHKELGPHGIHVATVAIHGTMRPNSPYAHDKVAAAYLALHKAERSDWQPDFHFRKNDEGAHDPDNG